MRYEMCKKRQGLITGMVSVVTPVYNGETHLPPMLDSILRQTYPKMEMILVDDGSTDRTVQVAEQYRKKFAAKGYGYRIIQAAHKNASAAINMGLPYVAGEYLVWPDSDDVLEPESVGKRVEFLKQHPQYQCVRSLSYYFDSKTGKLRKAEEQRGNLSKEELFWDILEAKTFVCCGCYMIKTDRFFEIYPDRHIPESSVGQNFQMLLPYMYRYKCPTIPEPLYGVCVREESRSRRKLMQEEEEKKYRDFERLVDEISEICRIHDKESCRRIACWKEKRRFIVSRKYGRKKESICALYHLVIYRGLEKEMAAGVFRKIRDCMFYREYYP